MWQRLRQEIRKIMNTPALSTDERILWEKDLGNGSLWRYAYIEEVLVFAGDVFKTGTTAIPAKSRVKSASLNLDTLGAYSAESNVNAVKLGIGPSGDPDQFLIDGGVVTKNTGTTVQPLEAVAINASAVTWRVNAVQTAGAIATVGTYTGTVRARIMYEYVTAIGQAA